MKFSLWQIVATASGLQLERASSPALPCHSGFDLDSAENTRLGAIQARACLQALPVAEQDEHLKASLVRLRSSIYEFRHTPMLRRAREAYAGLHKMDIVGVLSERVSARLANMSTRELWKSATRTLQETNGDASTRKASCGTACYFSAMSDLFYLWSMTKQNECKAVHASFWWPLGVEALKETECGGEKGCKSDAQAYVQLATMATTVGYGYAVAPAVRMWHILHSTAGAASVGSMADDAAKDFLKTMKPSQILTSLALEASLAAAVWVQDIGDERDKADAEPNPVRRYQQAIGRALGMAIGTAPTVGFGADNPLLASDRVAWATPGLIQALVSTTNYLKTDSSRQSEPWPSDEIFETTPRCAYAHRLPWSIMRSTSDKTKSQIEENTWTARGAKFEPAIGKYVEDEEDVTFLDYVSTHAVEGQYDLEELNREFQEKVVRGNRDAKAAFEEKKMKAKS